MQFSLNHIDCSLFFFLNFQHAGLPQDHSIIFVFDKWLAVDFLQTVDSGWPSHCTTKCQR